MKDGIKVLCNPWPECEAVSPSRDVVILMLGWPVVASQDTAESLYSLQCGWGEKGGTQTQIQTQLRDSGHITTQQHNNNPGPAPAPAVVTTIILPCHGASALRPARQDMRGGPRQRLQVRRQLQQTRVMTSAANQLIGEVVQSRRRPLLGPSPGWKRLLALSHLRHYAKQALTPR